jgi:hypothetical protein
LFAFFSFCFVLAFLFLYAIWVLWVACSLSLGLQSHA